MTDQLEDIADLRGWLELIDDVGELRHPSTARTGTRKSEPHRKSTTCTPRRPL